MRRLSGLGLILAMTVMALMPAHGAAAADGAAARTPIDAVRVTAADGVGTAAVYGPFNIRALHSGKCLDVTGGPSATGDGVRVQHYACLGASQTNQHWYLVEAGNGWYQIKPRHAMSRCLDVIGGGTGDGVGIQQYTCLGTTQANQLWGLFNVVGDAAFQLRPRHAQSKCLDVTGGTGATGNGIPVQQYACLGTANQYWYLTTV